LSRCLENKEVYTEELLFFITIIILHRHSLYSVSGTIKSMIEELNI